LILTATLAVLAFLVGLALMRHHRDDPTASAFADALIALVAIPAGAIRARGAAQAPAEPEKPPRKPRAIEAADTAK
jgi:hypothetical protein